MKTEKYFIQEKSEVFIKGETQGNTEWFDWYGTVDGRCISSDFEGFDLEDVAMSCCVAIPKMAGDEYRVIKRTTISIDEQQAYFKY